MSKSYKNILKLDRGKGYDATAVITVLAYILLLIYSILLFINFGFLSVWTLVTIFNIILVGVLIYILRLVIRTLFIWRDKMAAEILDKDGPE